MHVGFIDFDEGESLEPGEEAEREIVFSAAPGLVETLTPRREWRIQEGERLVGVGAVLEVLPTS